MKNPGRFSISCGKFFLWLGVLILFSFCWTHQVLADKDYFIESVIIQAYLNSDGSMDIKEKRTYKFRGHFHWAMYFLPTEKTGGVVDFSVGEEGRTYSRSYQGTEGTYQYEKTSGSISAKWFFDAKDQTRTFILSYRILDVVTAYQDAAVLYHKFVGIGWDKPSQQVKVTIYPPGLTGREEIRAWAHGPLWGSIEIGDKGSVIAEVQSLPAKTFWEVRSIYPVSLFPLIKNVMHQQAVPKILAEEKRWSDEANRKREEWTAKREAKKARKKLGSWIVLIISGIGFLSGISLYKRFGRKHKVSFSGTLYSEFPSDIPPALLSHLLYYRQIGGGALIGTLLDLARRGFLKIKEDMKMKKGIFGTSKNRLYFLELNRDFYSENKINLQDFEERLLAFIFDDLAGGEDVIDFKTLKKKRSRFIRWFRQWKQEVKKLGKNQGYWEKDSLKARNKGMVVGMVLIAVTVVSAILIEEWAIAPGISAFMLLVLSSFLPRRTPEFELEAKKWKALKKYLKKYHFRDSGSRFFIQNIGKFLVYGVVLGLSQEVIKKMAEMIPEGEHSSYVPWYAASHPYADFSPAGFGKALSSLMTAASATMSSAAGTGGGASGGGGGGTGGSGGGAG
ncbi:MAG: hypothetical protein AMJ91_02610 [candidate division Zixibacteria bacterium SM23_73_3]|nr:MAG: hypothetical protein AMJ91_02610 [candidate division Zixibacteria bacterium SM23_73_3]